jgi:hypothetical protein
MANHPPLPSAKLAERIVAALMDAGLLDARFEDEAIRVSVEEIEAAAAESQGKDGTNDRTA